ncbi:MmgE/PrpD family protein [Loktanella sp. IMCC34160]|uniref:MmgE/PrpD family protein n=1 Tax=Loktanella sp. IMCC34160 TaxID=2510646 RepID=UPI00101C760B|nr:MmgE/PrpD family protein [Loktanella sp. IMCC34160]RYG92104.1 MmgE/PrpD family protein [Loktanella sp. IMCC34160]
MSMESKLSEFTLAPLTGADDARAMMRLSLFDWAACGLAGVAEPLAAILRDKALAEGGAPQATLFGGGRVPARAAAQVNGAVSHALDYDDTHFAHIGHTSVGVVPAALAVAEREGADMAGLVDAALIGSEGAVRVGVWLGRNHYETGFHQTATAGAFGATMAAARLIGRDRADMALGLASTRAAGLKSQFGTMGKPWNAGLAAETGVEAATLAALGFTSNPSGLSGVQGFGPTHHGAAEEEALEGLGQVWLFPQVSHKFHACCHGLHATIEALGSLDLTAAQVDRVEVRTHPRWLRVCNKPAPQTGLEAKFSYAHVVAMVLAGVETSAIRNFSDALAQRADLVAIRGRVTVVPDSTLSEMQAVVTATLTDGTARTARHDLDAPISLEARGDKLRRKAAGLLGADRADALWAASMGDDLAGFAGLLAGG